MKPEPLYGKEKSKRKIMPKGTIIQTPNDIKRHSICDIHYFKEQDIKSAVEWLKESIKIRYMYHYDDKHTLKITTDDYLKLIDKAFQDVIKK